jgi:hypothetical protein
MTDDELKKLWDEAMPYVRRDARNQGSRNSGRPQDVKDASATIAAIPSLSASPTSAGRRVQCKNSDTKPEADPYFRPYGPEQLVA